MGTDVAEVVENLPLPSDIKVHKPMCTELMKLVDRVVKVFPEIEATRPRCSLGIESLCLLNKAVDKAKLLLQDCSESSKLYLALTGNTVLSRCKKSKSLLEQGLGQIQNMVPVMLAAEISRIIAELRGVMFNLDPREEEAGKAVKALLEEYKTGSYSVKESSIKHMRIAALILHITSQKDLLIERRSIKKLINKIGDNDGNQPKKQILFFLLDLLKKHGKSITSERLEIDNNVQNQDYHFPKVDSRLDLDREVAQNDMFGRANVIPPEEFKCPISLKLMYDPVIIASGQTFERMWIQKWFDEGHDVCPKTKRKLSDTTLTPNTAMKDLISRWCDSHGITIPDPCIQFSSDTSAWENSSSSINSLSISMNNLQLPVDYSNVSLGSLDNSHNSISSYVKAAHDSLGVEAIVDNREELDVRLSLELDDAVPWESKCKAVEDLMTLLKRDDQACNLISHENLVEALIRFLKVALDIHDVRAQRIGCLLLLTLVNKCRRSIPYLTEGVYGLVATFLESEVIEEALAITEVLSSYQNCRSEIAASGALTSIFNILESQILELQTPAMKILYNLTLTRKIHSLVISLDLIPKLVPFFEHDSLSRYCVAILKNLCDNRDAKRIIVETDGCLSFTAKVLENDSCEEQEHAVEILLSLCSQSIQFCHLVMDEGVIPSVVSISINGNDIGKAKAMELLRLLRDIEYDDHIEESPAPDVDTTKESNVELNDLPKEKKTSGATRLFPKFSIFSRRSSAQKRNI